jgi:hypothetical protein
MRLAVTMADACRLQTKRLLLRLGIPLVTSDGEVFANNSRMVGRLSGQWPEAVYQDVSPDYSAMPTVPIDSLALSRRAEVPGATQDAPSLKCRCFTNTRVGANQVDIALEDSGYPCASPIHRLCPTRKHYTEWPSATNP